MNTIEITTAYAFTALIDRLALVKGAALVEIDEMSHRAVYAYEDNVLPEAAEALTTVFYHEWLHDYVQSALIADGNPLTEDELEYLTIVYLHEMESSVDEVAEHPMAEWIKRTRRDILTLLSTESFISIDGFARFRLRRLLNAITSQVSEKANQLLLDREYEDSIAVLRYMLDARPQGRQELHVFSAPERVWITDESGELLRDVEVTEAALAESPANLDSEDLAMSILITRSPCRIVFHDLFPEAPWPSFAETVLRVFRERARPCERCSTCEQLKNANSPAARNAVRNQSFPRN